MWPIGLTGGFNSGHLSNALIGLASLSALPPALWFLWPLILRLSPEKTLICIKLIIESSTSNWWLCSTLVQTACSRAMGTAFLKKSWLVPALCIWCRSMLGETSLGFLHTVPAAGVLFSTFPLRQLFSLHLRQSPSCGEPTHFSRPSSGWDKSFLAPRILYLYIILARYPIHSVIIHVPLLPPLRCKFFERAHMHLGGSYSSFYPPWGYVMFSKYNMKSHEVGNIIIPIVQMRKLRLRECKYLVQGHPAGGRRSQDPGNPGS